MTGVGTDIVADQSMLDSTTRTGDRAAACATTTGSGNRRSGRSSAKKGTLVCHRTPPDPQLARRCAASC
jgi:hypothetical protein